MADQPNSINVIAAFSQGKRNNCASIAVIKAAITRFGIGGIFKESTQGSVIKFTLKDGNVVSAALNELAVLEKEADFQKGSDDAVRTYAKRCFGVMALEYARSHNIGLKRALGAINETGLNTDLAFEYLGIEEKNVFRLEYTDQGTADLSRFHSEEAYVLYNSYHAAFASKENYDEYSKTTPTGIFTSKHRKGPLSGRRFWAYRLK